MKKNDQTISLSKDIDWSNAKGPVDIRMTNDYLFRAMLQKNNDVLKALIASLLHLNTGQISSAIITNPIILGDSIDARTFVLDIRVLMNENTIINLEMQVINEKDWPERSLTYLCRAFDNLNRGEDYLHVKPVVQIGLLDFTLFEDTPEFYSTNKLMNVKNHRIYSDKLRLSVLDLNQIQRATEEDRLYGLDHWAALFKATTWEELKMLSKSDQNIQNAAKTVYQLSQDEKIRLQCEALEEYQRLEKTRQLRLEGMEKALADKDQAIADRDLTIADKDLTIADRDQAIADRDLTIADREAEIEKLRQKLREHGIE